MSKTNDLLNLETAGETLGLDEAEVAELLKTGDLRKVWHRAGNDPDASLDIFVMGADVKRLKQQSDPKYLAAVVRGEIQAEDDDGDTPRSLARSVGRL